MVSLFSKKYKKSLNKLSQDSSFKINNDGFYLNIRKGTTTVNYKLDGKYFTETDTNKTYINAIFFNEDGTLRFYDGFDNFSLTSSETLIAKYISNKYVDRHFGYYRLKGDSIRLIYFFHDTSRFRTWIFVEWKMKMKSNDRITLYKEICDRCKNNYFGYDSTNTILYNPSQDFKFIALPNKPDSSSEWYKTKRWYRNGLKDLNK